MSNNSMDQLKEIAKQLFNRAQKEKEAGNLVRFTALTSAALSIAPFDMDLSDNVNGRAQELYFNGQFDLALTILSGLGIVDDEYSLYASGYPDYYSALALVKIGVIEAAEFFFMRALAKDPGIPGLDLNYGYYLLHSGKYSEGVDILKGAAEDYIDKEEIVDIFEAIAWAEFKLNRKQEVLDYLLDRIDYYLFSELDSKDLSPFCSPTLMMKKQLLH